MMTKIEFFWTYITTMHAFSALSTDLLSQMASYLTLANWAAWKASFRNDHVLDEITLENDHWERNLSAAWINNKWDESLVLLNLFFPIGMHPLNMLEKAIIHWRTDVATVLFSYISPNCGDGTPLALAIMHRNVELVEHMLEASADPRYDTYYVMEKEPKLGQCLFGVSGDYTSSEKAICDLLVKYGILEGQAAEKMFDSACHCGDLNAAQKLLPRVSLDDPELLRTAVVCDQPEMVEFLIQNGAAFGNLIVARDDFISPACMFALLFA